MANTNYWTASGYQVALASITTATTKFEDISDTDVSTFEDGGLKTGGATNSTITALWDLGSDQSVDGMKGSVLRMDTLTYQLEYSTAASAGASWTTPFGGGLNDFGAPSNALSQFDFPLSFSSVSARYWRLSVKDQPFNYAANTRVELGTFRLYNGATLYTTSGGGGGGTDQTFQSKPRVLLNTNLLPNIAYFVRNLITRLKAMTLKKKWQTTYSP
jgi:hypothetical protein